MWDAFKDAIFWCIQFFQGFLVDWGLAILVVTLIFRLILTPLMQKQIKSTYYMQKLQPQIQEIQQKYEGDQQRVAEETQKVYAELGFNPLAGCLPLLLQMPIFIALFQVLREMEQRVGSNDLSFFNILPNLVVSPADMFAVGIVPFIPYAILLLIFAGATFLPSMLTMRQNPAGGNQSMIMMVVMSLMMVWIGWGSPAGVLLFWAASSVYGVCQQQISMAIYRRRDEAAEAAKADEIKPVEVDVERKQHKKRPTKSR